MTSPTDGDLCTFGSASGKDINYYLDGNTLKAFIAVDHSADIADHFIIENVHCKTFANNIATYLLTAEIASTKTLVKYD